jgi:hypothetical protein
MFTVKSGNLIYKCCLEFELLSSAALSKQSAFRTLPSSCLIAFASNINLTRNNDQVLPGKLDSREVFCHLSCEKYSGFDSCVAQPFFCGGTPDSFSYAEEPLPMRTLQARKS